MCKPECLKAVIYTKWEILNLFKNEVKVFITYQSSSLMSVQLNYVAVERDIQFVIMKD